LAEKHPGLVKQIAGSHHELASHGYSHRLVFELEQEEFREDVVRAKRIIEEISGEQVQGYRAPSWSITRRNAAWALPILDDAGFKYDSSLLPGSIRFGGGFATREFPYVMESGLWEFPPSSFQLLGRRIPFSGGAYLRLLPYSLTKALIHRINALGKPAIIYLHPWELDQEHPRVNLPPTNRFIHYCNLRVTEAKFKALLGEFKFGPVRDIMSTKFPACGGKSTE